MAKTLEVVLQESWNDNLIDPREPYYDTPGFGWLARRMGFYSNRADRLHGRYAPIYDNEFDLKAIRMAAWVMDAEVPVAKAMKARLVDYTIASGFDWEIKHESPEIQQYLEQAIKTFFDNCDWAELEVESFEREIVDGEFLAEIVASSGEFSIDVLEGDFVTEPIHGAALERYLDIDYEPSWSFGVLTQKNKCKPLAYHVVRDESGTDWDVVPAGQFIHWKRNTPRNAKRGASDHFTTHKWLGYGNKVLSATAQGAAIQASIAYIIEHAAGVTGTQAAALAAARNNVVVNRDSVTGDTYNSRKIRPGQVVDVKQGQKYHAGLFGSNGSKIYIDVMTALFRLSGTIYAFPEHMLTGYAGNNNLASSITAESPFLQGRARDQRRRAERMRRFIMQICQLVIERMPGRRWDWEEVLLGLSVQINTPDIRSRDIGALTAALVAQADRGWVSNRQAVQDLGRDYDDVQAQLKEERKDIIVQPPDGKETNADPKDDEKKEPADMQEGVKRLAARMGDTIVPLGVNEASWMAVSRLVASQAEKYPMTSAALAGGPFVAAQLAEELEILSDTMESDDLSQALSRLADALDESPEVTKLEIETTDEPTVPPESQQMTKTMEDLMTRWKEYP